MICNNEGKKETTSSVVVVVFTLDNFFTSLTQSLLQVFSFKIISLNHALTDSNWQGCESPKGKSLDVIANSPRKMMQNGKENLETDLMFLFAGNSK